MALQRAAGALIRRQQRRQNHSKEYGKMLLVFVIGISLVVIAIAAAIDSGTAYYADRRAWKRSTQTSSRKSWKRPSKVARIKQEVKKGMETRRNLKKIENGLHMVSKREESVVRPRGSHRRLQAT